MCGASYPSSVHNDWLKVGQCLVGHPAIRSSCKNYVSAKINFQVEYNKVHWKEAVDKDDTFQFGQRQNFLPGFLELVEVNSNNVSPHAHIFWADCEDAEMEALV
ncbi:Alkaline phosphatase [Sesbania bispinosa]|nr:Alkaline phosphatase [Sesbania bispinosa]